ncbi:MAG: aminotransferase class V-fold PLP-dependent enzyme [Phycisphaerae bacterium]
MKRIYLDNAATSFPKPPQVYQAMIDYATRIGASAGRGAYGEAIESGRMIGECRKKIAQLICAPDPNHIIMTFNCTDGLNLAIHGLLNSGDHVITIWMNHNSVLRPLNELKSRIGLQVDFVPCAFDGIVDPDDIRRAIKPNTKLIAILHGSNVTGTVEPIHQIAKIAREHDLLILVDAAQTIGHLPIDVQKDQIDFLAAPGHKGLLGALGTGFLYIRPGLEKILRPLKQGGTGSWSEEAVQPQALPDKYESGSHNALGIAGLTAGLDYLLNRTVADIHQQDRALCRKFMAGLDEIDGLTWFGPRESANRIGVFSVRMEGYTPRELSAALESKFGILTRSGLHCAPLAHKTIGTLENGGTTRFSFGPFITIEDLDYILNALQKLSVRSATTLV